MVVFNLAICATFDNDSYSVQVPTDTDTHTEYLFNVVHVKHGTNISSVELLLRRTMVYQQNHR